jgi:DNA-directed RNA polymerase subunit L
MTFGGCSARGPLFDKRDHQLLRIVNDVLNRDEALLFVEGLVGRNFAKALAFYLDHVDEYLDALKKAARRIHLHTRGQGIPG